ncbi:putative reverse transcriptase domain, reverse transcriptase zinc-binding domain protein [Tanacetum coccineum]
MKEIKTALSSIKLSKEEEAGIGWKLFVMKVVSDMKERSVLKNFGFHQKMVGWIMKCVRTIGFSISINGERHGYFKGRRGLRQGDPISPYLFTLIMEILTLLLQRKIRNNNKFKYHHGCKGLQLVNLCFADDLMIFCNGDLISAELIKEALNEFSKVSGLFPNLNKSTLFFW